MTPLCIIYDTRCTGFSQYTDREERYIHHFNEISTVLQDLTDNVVNTSTYLDRQVRTFCSYGENTMNLRHAMENTFRGLGREQNGQFFKNLRNISRTYIIMFRKRPNITLLFYYQSFSFCTATKLRKHLVETPNHPDDPE